MPQWSVNQIAEIVNGRIIGSTNIMISSLTLDSRKASPGSLFVPLRGENFDGHMFISNAFKNGAAASFASKEISNVPKGCAVIVVDDPLIALQKLGIYRLQQVSPQVVAVTGSTGKTSTKEMIATIVEKKYSTFKSKGNLNSEQGLPLSLFSLEANNELAVLEMGMRGSGQITELVNIAPPDIAVITNIGTVHLELLGTRENLALAKGEILAGLKQGGLAVLNGDDQWCKWLANSYHGDLVYFGLNEECDYRAVDLSINEDGCYSYTLLADNQRIVIKLPIAGKHQVYNSLAGIAVARSLKMNWDDILRGIISYSTIKGRQKRLSYQGMTIIDDTYNSNPDSIRAGLELLKLSKTSGKRIAVLGDMRELGTEAVSLHQAVGLEIANFKVDILICNGDLAEHIGKAVTGDKIKVYYAKSNSEALYHLQNTAKCGDVILIKGSRGLEMEHIVSEFCKGK